MTRSAKTLEAEVSRGVRIAAHRPVLKGSTGAFAGSNANLYPAQTVTRGQGR
ncbi:hypothetical protein LMG29542_04916 [Paraburkholderia humisilvae]|uniref:Uncharacterized protein n=1 Tax=Paraburkholderia humisilvae TaxID=627669 RepID=A0A6J5EE14_9BURK|nr:hypothetical protein LMG29542_04916 [Paraburkholderia humisilvae]